MSIEFVEGTTMQVVVSCYNKEDKSPFDLDGYTMQAVVIFTGQGGKVQTYLDTQVTGNDVVFTIPAALTVGKVRGTAEVRGFKGEEVIPAGIIDIDLIDSKKPDIIYHGGEE